MKWHGYEKELVHISNQIIKKKIKKGVQPEDAKDIVQSSLLKLFEFNHDISFDSLKSWLYRVSFNQFYTEYNRYKLMNSIKEKYLIPELKQIEKEAFDETYLLQALLDLKEEEFNIVLLKYIEKLSYKELSIIFNRSEDVLKTETYRIRKKLKKKIKELENYDDR